MLPALGAVDAVVTDPPFKLSQEYGSGADADNLLAVSCIWEAARRMLLTVKPGGLCVLFYDTRILPLALESMRVAGWKYLRGLTFYRRWGRASVVHGWMTTSDFLLVFRKPGEKAKFHGSVKHDVYVKTGPEEGPVTGHPAQKPADTLCHLVTNVAAPGGLVLDPFMGSGTTGVACVRTGRKFVGIEQDEHYFGVSRKRIEEALAEQKGKLFSEGGVP